MHVSSTVMDLDSEEDYVYSQTYFSHTLVTWRVLKNRDVDLDRQRIVKVERNEEASKICGSALLVCQQNLGEEPVKSSSLTDVQLWGDGTPLIKEQRTKLIGRPEMKLIALIRKRTRWDGFESEPNKENESERFLCYISGLFPRVQMLEAAADLRHFIITRRCSHQ